MADPFSDRRGARKHGFWVTDAGGNRHVLPFTTSSDVVLGDGTTGSVPPSSPLAHATSHEDGGSDEIDVTGLSGVLDEPQLVDVDPAGALDGDSATTPLAVRVDGTTIEIDGSNNLHVLSSSATSAWIPLVDGAEPPTFITDGLGVLILVNVDV